MKFLVVDKPIWSSRGSFYFWLFLIPIFLFFILESESRGRLIAGLNGLFLPLWMLSCHRYIWDKVSVRTAKIVATTLSIVFMVFILLNVLS